MKTVEQVRELDNERLLRSYATLINMIDEDVLKGKKRKDIVDEKDLVKSEILRRMGSENGKTGI